MKLPVRRLVVRSSIVSALALGLLAVAPEAVADAPCPEGTARVFLANSTNTCQGGGTVGYDPSAPVSKVCSTPTADVTAEATFKNSRGKLVTQKLDLSDGRCGRFDIPGQLSATVTVS
ncbi:hypothetical protein OH799_15475 [Nocardia sp. NBC_00881]|uniref:hypothetical protein n=1 Tax=Nocardia sp. NBC_00881 TaxID=2975995 RepID=UPI00386A9D95|nr:hypothetical protein OH799_15475 [Nocardia sp. NBC_00881]